MSIRTLRYYDREGLLSPSSYTEAGYRLYTDADFSRLQQILALKFLGFSLDEIKHCLQVGPTRLQEALALQRTMMREKREQLNTVIEALDETEKLLQSNEQDWEAIIHVIQVIQMQEKSDWRKKYFTDEQLSQMEELHRRYYSEEQLQQLAEWGKDYTEEDQLRAQMQWNMFFAELKRLVAAGADPASPEAQALASQWHNLISQFTHGDAGIARSLKNMYTAIADMPAGTAPYPAPYSKEEEAFIQAAITVFRQHQGQ